MRLRLRLQLVCTLATLAAGCTHTVTATQIFVEVRSDIPAAQLTRAALVVERLDGSPLFSKCLCIGEGPDCKPWPLSLGLGPRGMDDAPFRVRAQGFASDCGAPPIVEQTAVVSFVEGSSLELSMYLYAECEGIHCATGQTCAGGKCGNEAQPNLPSLGADFGGATLDFTAMRDLGGASDRVAMEDAGPDLAMDLAIFDIKMPDFVTTADESVPDFAISDLTMPDLVSTEDFSMVDLAKFDQAMPDFVSMGDISMVDLSVRPDLKPPSDSGAPKVFSLLGPASYVAGPGPYSVALGDLNGDGKPDLVVANYAGDSVSVLLNKGNGTFAGGSFYAAGGSPTSVSLGDLDGDGKTDIAVANSGGNGVSVLLNNGNGTFAAASNYAPCGTCYSVALGDLNGDGKVDIAVAGGGDGVSVFLNVGNVTFAAPRVYAPGMGGNSIVLGDLNGDGTADLAVANPGVSVLLNNGNGTFAPAANYNAGSSPFSLALGDLNGDGKTDLAVADIGADSNNVRVLLNKGHGTFAAATAYSGGRVPSSIALGDLNGDGMADLAVANPNASTFNVLLNNGNGTFAASLSYTVGSLPYSMAIGDLNGDGLLDVVVADENDKFNRVFVLLNTTH